MTEYMPLHACLWGLAMVCKSVMGLNLVEQPLPPRESWAKGVKKMALAEVGRSAFASLGPLATAALRMKPRTPSAGVWRDHRHPVHGHAAPPPEVLPCGPLQYSKRTAAWQAGLPDARRGFGVQL